MTFLFGTWREERGIQFAYSVRSFSFVFMPMTLLVVSKKKPANQAATGRTVRCSRFPVKREGKRFEKKFKNTFHMDFCFISRPAPFPCSLFLIKLSTIPLHLIYVLLLLHFLNQTKYTSLYILPLKTEKKLLSVQFPLAFLPFTHIFPEKKLSHSVPHSCILAKQANIPVQETLKYASPFPMNPQQFRLEARFVLANKISVRFIDRKPSSTNSGEWGERERIEWMTTNATIFFPSLFPLFQESIFRARA